MDAIQEFQGAMRAHGLTPPEIIEPGKLHRFATNGKRHDDAGWCRLFPDCAGGVFGDFRSGLSETWQAQREKPFTPTERQAFRQRCEAERRAREAEIARGHAEAAKKARSVWAAATSLREPHPHPYLRKKGVSPVPELREIHAEAVKEIIGYRPQSRGETLAGRLLVGRIQAGDELVSVELIDELGRKSALAGGPKKGGYWLAQELPDGDGQGLVLLLGEGIATVLSAKEATGHLVIAALTCGNLLTVAKAIRKRFPAAKLDILADLGNGQKHAEKAARAAGAALVLPDFGEDRPEWASDFNDMHRHRSLEAVAECIRRQVSSKRGVPGVLGVPASPGAGSSRNTRKKAGVPGVPKPAEDPAPEAEDPASVSQDNPIPSPSDRPCFRVFDEWIEHPTGKLRPGVWFFGVKQAKRAEEPPILTQEWFARPCTSML